MKKIPFLSLVLFCFIAISYGQSVKDTTYNFSNGEILNAFTAFIPDGTSETIQSNWVKTVEKGSKTDAVVLNSLITLDKAVIKKISADTIRVVAEIYQTTAGTKLVFAIGHGSTYLGNGVEPIKTEAAKIWLGEFVISNYSTVVKNELKAEQKVEKSIQKELDKNIKSIDKDKNKIAGLESDIKTYQNNISSYESDEKIKQSKIEEQKIFIAGIPANNYDSKTEAEKTLKTLNKELTKILKNIEKEKKKITKAENSIRDYNSNITSLEQDQKIINDRLAVQREKVKLIEVKLSGIK